MSSSPSQNRTANFPGRPSESKTKRLLRLVTDPDYRRQYLALRSLRRKPRHVPGATTILGAPVLYSDSGSFRTMYREIFIREIYRFVSQGSAPYIVDGGANIGLSVLYFKRLYPLSKIIAFEPDPNLSSLLRQNLETAGYPDVEVVSKAIWSSAGHVAFRPDGGLGGRITHSFVPAKATMVATAALTDYLSEKVALLKLDVEGAELEALTACASKLHRVERIFVEYHSFLGQEQTLPELLHLLRDAGFRLFLEQTGAHNQRPFCSITEIDGMDLQLNIFASRTGSL